MVKDQERDTRRRPANQRVRDVTRPPATRSDWDGVNVCPQSGTDSAAHSNTRPPNSFRMDFNPKGKTAKQTCAAAATFRAEIPTIWATLWKAPACSRP
jgi:hypothetical protein